jgi:predicted RNA-binding protein with PIN domain
MNVIGARPDGWWRDRRGAMRRLVEQLRRHATATGDTVTVVFDGRPFALGREVADPPRVVFAPRPGSNAADDVIVELAGADEDPSALEVVTSDRELAARVRAVGAEVVGARSFASRLEPVP